MVFIQNRRRHHGDLLCYHLITVSHVSVLPFPFSLFHLLHSTHVDMVIHSHHGITQLCCYSQL